MTQSQPSISPKPLILAIVDGFGIAENNPANAIGLAKTPNIDTFLQEYDIKSLRDVTSHVSKDHKCLDYFILIGSNSYFILNILGIILLLLIVKIFKIFL